jgi:hypothetical protein
MESPKSAISKNRPDFDLTRPGIGFRLQVAAEQRPMTEGLQSMEKETFAGAPRNDGVAPTAVTRRAGVEPLSSTQTWK